MRERWSRVGAGRERAKRTPKVERRKPRWPAKGAQSVFRLTFLSQLFYESKKRRGMEKYTTSCSTTCSPLDSELNSMPRSCKYARE